MHQVVLGGINILHSVSNTVVSRWYSIFYGIILSKHYFLINATTMVYILNYEQLVSVVNNILNML